MISVSICEQAISVFIFASTSCLPISRASSKYRWRTAPISSRKPATMKYDKEFTNKRNPC